MLGAAARDGVEERPLGAVARRVDAAAGEGEVDEGVEGDVVRAGGEGGVDVGDGVGGGLAREGEDEVHRDRVERDGAQGGLERRGRDGPAPERGQEPGAEGLHADAQPGRAGVAERPEGRGDGVVGVPLGADAVRHLEAPFERGDDAAEPGRGQRRRAAAEVEARRAPAPGAGGGADDFDLALEGVEVAGAERLVVANAAVGAEPAQAPAEGDVDVEPEVAGAGEGRRGVGLVRELERTEGAREPGGGEGADGIHGRGS